MSIRNCILAFKCNKIWEDLAETEDDDIKFCGDCQRTVRLTVTDKQIARAIRNNWCVHIAEDRAQHIVPLTGLPSKF